MWDEYIIKKEVIISIKNIENLLNNNYDDKKIFFKDLIWLLSLSYFPTKIQVFILNS
jgi:hypothetical protein